MEKRTAIVTGAAKGIGKAIAEQLALSGIRVAICDINADLLPKTVAELAARTQTKVIGELADVSQEEAVSRFVEKAQHELGTVDILINNAGLYILHKIEEVSADEWDRVMAVNLKSYFLMAKAVLPAMKAQNYGRIINIASAAGKSGGTVCGIHYAASKGGVIAMTYHLAKQVGQYGITVNAIAPANIKTDMVLNLPDKERQALINSTAVKKLGETQNVTGAVQFLIGENAGFITGETIDVNGGSLMD